MLTAMSISAVWSAATRTACSGIGRKISVLTLGAPPHQLGLASSSMSSSLTQRTNLYGPVPTGFRSANTLSFPRKCLGAMMCPRRARWFSSVGYGLAVAVRVGWLSNASLEGGSPRRTSVAQRRVMVRLLSGHAVAGACAPTSWLSRSCPRESSAPGWCNCTSVVQEDEAFWPVVLPEGKMKPLVIWLPVQVVSGTECAVMRLSDGILHAGSAGPSVQHHEDHQREARGARQSDRADQHTVSRAPQHPRGEGRHYSGGMECRHGGGAGRLCRGPRHESPTSGSQ